MRRPDGITLAAFAGAVLIAGINFVAVKFSNLELDPLFGAALRFTVAATITFAIIAARRIPLPRGRALTGALLYGGLFFFVAFGLMYYAIVKVPAGIAGVVMASVPLLTLVFASLHRLEPFRRRGLVGALITIVGIAILLNAPAGDDFPLLSLLAMIGAAACIAESGIVIKKFPPSHPMATNAVAMLVGALLLISASLVAGENWALPLHPETWWALSYLVLVGSILVFALYLFVLKRWSATGASYQFVLIPLVAVVVGALLADESITIGILLGGLIVLTGVYVGALSHPRREAVRVDDRRQEALSQVCS